MHPDDHVFHTLLSQEQNLSFPLLIQPPATSSQQMMVQSWSNLPLQIQNYAWQYSGKLLSLTVEFNLTLVTTILYCSVIIDIDSCCILISWLSWPCCFKNLALNPAAHKIDIMARKQALVENKASLNSATTRVVVTQIKYSLWFFSLISLASIMKI